MRLVSLIALIVILKNTYAQKILEINYHSLFGKEKSFQFFNNSDLDYKLKGRFLYKTHKLVNMNDRCWF